MSKLVELLEAIRLARNEFVRVQSHLHKLEWELFQIRYQEYLDRAERFTQEHPGMQPLELWFQEVRPVCRDCRLEIRYEDNRHSVNSDFSEPAVYLSCGRRYPW